MIPLKGYSPFYSHFLRDTGFAWHFSESIIGPVQLVAELVAFW